jgi:hypothetical protein
MIRLQGGLKTMLPPRGGARDSLFVEGLADELGRECA